jgi:hypothetical protein
MSASQILTTPELQSPNSVGTQKVAGKCLHGLQPTWCAICTPKPRMVDPRESNKVDFLRKGCAACGAEVEVNGFGRLYKYCDDCRKHDHGARTKEMLLLRNLRVESANIAVGHLRSFKYMSFDGRWEGPDNLHFTVLVGLRKDHGYHAMPIDVHVRPIEPKFNLVTPEDVDWSKRQRQFRQPDELLKPKTNFCPTCSVEREEVVLQLKREWWIEKGRLVHEDHVVQNRVKKITRGKYVLQGHICNA